MDGLTCVNNEGVTVLKNVSFCAMGGEILGIAGIAGSGQKGLCRPSPAFSPSRGHIRYTGPDAEPTELVGRDSMAIRDLGISWPLSPRTGWAWAWWPPWAWRAT